MYFEITLTNADDVIQALERKKADFPRMAQSTVYDIGNVIRNKAIGRSPVVTGFMKNSHVFELLSPYEGVMYPDAPYAPFVILGHNIVSTRRATDRWHMKTITGRTKPNPYLKESVAIAWPEIQRILGHFTSWMEAV